MNVVHEDVEQCVGNELQHAVSVYGLHHSWHEKYAVTLEEMRELDEAVKVLWHELEIAFRMTMQNAPDSEIEQEYECIYDAAKDAAIEAIQVAAMAKKEIEEPKEIADPAELCDHGLYSGHDPVRVFRCTNCGHDFVAGIHPHPFYCPRCGAEFANVLRL